MKIYPWKEDTHQVEQIFMSNDNIIVNALLGTDESVNLPSEAGSQRYDYVRMIRDYLKTPETPYSDSGIGKTRTRTPTMSSQLTVCNMFAVIYAMADAL